MQKNRPKLKFVKKANMWVVTYWKEGVAKRQWFSKDDEKDAQDFVDDLIFNEGMKK